MLCRYQFLSTTLLLVAHTKTLEKMDRILTEERFLLFSQRCILRNTADLLHFIVHRVLSVTSVKKVCCQNGIPHTLRDELTCGSFQLFIRRLTITRIVFYFPLWNKLVLTLTEDIIIQTELEKQDKNQILGKKFWNLSDFELKTLQRVRFWIKNFTTRQILN